MAKRTRKWTTAALVAAVVATAGLAGNGSFAADEAAPPAAAREIPATDGNPPLPVPPKPAVQKPVKKKRAVRRGEQGEKLTVDQVAEIMEEWGGDLGGKDLRGLNLVGFNLRRANLAGATLTGANLERADLQEANLERADLGKANLRRATVRFANLRGTNLEEANLEGAVWTDGSICAKGSIGTCRERE